MNCYNCGSKGFAPSRMNAMCEFCDGTYGGNPPTDEEVEAHNNKQAYGLPLFREATPLFIGDNKEAHQIATQKLTEAAVHLRRADEALMALQAMFPTTGTHRDDVRNDRRTCQKMAERYDEIFQRAAQTYFA